MNWGQELFDRYDELIKHLNTSIDFMEQNLRMNQERVKIELDYAKQMKKMVKNHTPKKKNDYGGRHLSYETSYEESMKEINSIALQHELVAENLKQTVIDPMTKAIHDLKKARSHFQTEYAKMDKSMARSMTLLDAAFKRYRAAHADMLKADEAYRAAEENRNLARVEVDRQKQYAEGKRNECERQKSDYAAQLENTNKFRSEYYRNTLPSLLNDMQSADRTRTEAFVSSLKMVAESESKVMHTIGTCHDGVISCAKEINWQQDSDIIVDYLRSGYAIPNEIPFNDLDTVSTAGSLDSLQLNQAAAGSSNTLRQKNKERGGFASIFKSKQKTSKQETDLGPEQQRKKIAAAIKDVQSQIAAEEKTKTSMVRLLKTFENDPKNAQPVQAKVNESDMKLQGLNEELARLEATMNEVTGGKGQSSNGQISGSVSGSVSVRSSTASTVVSTRESAQPKLSVSSNRGKSEDDDDDFADEFDAPPAVEQPGQTGSFVGGCIALYDFESEDGSGLSMHSGDQFYVVMADSGDGWTLVTTLDSRVQGYVPSGYLDIRMY